MPVIPYSYSFTATNGATTTKNVECTRGILRWVSARNTGTSGAAPVIAKIYLEDRRHPATPLIPLAAGIIKIPQNLASGMGPPTAFGIGIGKFPNLEVTNRHRLRIVVDNDVGANQTIAIEWGIEK